MSKPKIYIETTIPNFFYDFKNQSNKKRIGTVFFWENSLKNFESLTSTATIRGLEATPKEEWRISLLKFIDEIKIIEINEEAMELAEQYVKDKLVPQNYSADALHLAVTVINKIDYLLTWNIQHLAHPSKRKMFREYNACKGYYVTEIVTPEELNYKINNSA